MTLWTKSDPTRQAASHDRIAANARRLQETQPETLDGAATDDVLQDFIRMLRASVSSRP